MRKRDTEEVKSRCIEEEKGIHIGEREYEDVLRVGEQARTQARSGLRFGNMLHGITLAF